MVEICRPYDTDWNKYATLANVRASSGEIFQEAGSERSKRTGPYTF